MPWANACSGFTLLFEAWALMLAGQMTMADVARLLGVRAKRLWRRLVEQIEQGRAQQSYAGVTAVTVDETAVRRGHVYITVFADPIEKRVLFFDDGKDALTFSDFVSEMREHDVDPSQIETISMDFSGAFKAGAKRHLPDAQVCFDQFHLIFLACTTVDEMRRNKVKTAPELKGESAGRGTAGCSALAALQDRNRRPVGIELTFEWILRCYST